MLISPSPLCKEYIGEHYEQLFTPNNSNEVAGVTLRNGVITVRLLDTRKPSSYYIRAPDAEYRNRVAENDERQFVYGERFVLGNQFILHERTLTLKKRVINSI